MLGNNLNTVIRGQLYFALTSTTGSNNRKFNATVYEYLFPYFDPLFAATTDVLEEVKDAG